jgi:hypothetical protein
MSSTADQRTTTDDRPTTREVRQRLEQMSNKRSRSSFIIGTKIFFSLRLLDVINDRPTTNEPTNNKRTDQQQTNRPTTNEPTNNKRPTNDDKRGSSAVGADV